MSKSEAPLTTEMSFSDSKSLQDRKTRIRIFLFVRITSSFSLVNYFYFSNIISVVLTNTGNTYHTPNDKWNANTFYTPTASFLN